MSVDVFARAMSDNALSQISDLDTQIMKGNKGLTHLFNKIAPWNRTTSGAGVDPSFPSQLNYGTFGDSTATLAWYNIPSSFSHNIYPYPGVMGNLSRANAECLNAFPTTITGTGWYSDNSAGKYYDYTISPHGQYYHLENSCIMRSSASLTGTEYCIYYIKESSAGTFTLQLRNNTDAGNITVNSVAGEITGISCDATIGAGKAGFCYMTIKGVGASAGQFQLNFGGEWTANIAYNASATTVQSALEALTGIGVGNVGVEKSGTTWTVLIKSNNFGWHTLDWRDGSTPLTGYLTFGVGDRTHLKVTVTSGTIRTWQPYAINRAIHGVATYPLSRGGLRLGDAITWNSTIENSILGDIKLDFASVVWTAPQAGQHTVTPPSTFSTYSLAELESNLSSFISKIETAYDKTDLIFQSFPPSNSDRTDAIILAANPAAKIIVENAGYIWIDTYGAMGCGWEGLTLLDGYTSMDDFDANDLIRNQWTGDGIHLGNAYNSYVGSVVLKQIGIYDYAGVLGWKRLNIDYGLLAGVGLDLSKGTGQQIAGRLRAEQTSSLDVQLMMATYNRCFQLVDKDNYVYVQLGTYNNPNTNLGTYFVNPVHFGAYDGPQVAPPGNGSPEGVVTAAPGSLYLNKDGGSGVSIYFKESGTGNTGWVARIVA